MQHQVEIDGRIAKFFFEKEGKIYSIVGKVVREKVSPSNSEEDVSSYCNALSVSLL